MKPPLVDVVCAGEVLWDLYEIDNRTVFRHVGGSSANLAIHLARCGWRAAVVASVGNDRLGDLLEETLDGEGVGVRHLLRLPGRTGITFVRIGAGGEPRYLSYRDGTANLALRRPHIVPAMTRARYVVVGSALFASSGIAGAGRALVGAAERGPAQVVLDINARPHLWSSRAEALHALTPVFARADIVKASAADLEALEIDEQDLLRRVSARAVVIVTRGPGAATAWTRGEEGIVEVAARRVKRIVDTAGAGDAFTAGMLAARLDGGNWTSALALGHTLGAKVVSTLGAVSWPKIPALFA